LSISSSSSHGIGVSFRMQDSRTPGRWREKVGKTSATSGPNEHTGEPASRPDLIGQRTSRAGHPIRARSEPRTRRQSSSVLRRDACEASRRAPPEARLARDLRGRESSSASQLHASYRGGRSPPRPWRTTRGGACPTPPLGSQSRRARRLPGSAAARAGPRMGVAAQLDRAENFHGAGHLIRARSDRCRGICGRISPHEGAIPVERSEPRTRRQSSSELRRDACEASRRAPPERPRAGSAGDAVSNLIGQRILVRESAAFLRSRRSLTPAPMAYERGAEPARHRPMALSLGEHVGSRGARRREQARALASRPNLIGQRASTVRDISLELDRTVGPAGRRLVTEGNCSRADRAIGASLSR